MPDMQLAGPRYKLPISEQECARRLSAVQNAMRATGIDCCIAQTQNKIFESIVRYLTDSFLSMYSTTLIIPAEGKLTVINHGVDCDDAAIPPFLRNTGKLISKPYCPPFGCTDHMIGSVIVNELKALKPKRVGLICRQLMAADTYAFITERMPDVEWTDFTKEFCYIKAVKSKEELVLADKCIQAHDRLMKMVPGLLRPGRMEYEIVADLEWACRYMNCDWTGNIAVGSIANGGGIMFFQNYNANRRLEAGDGVTVMIEVAGPGGIYGELARTFCLGEPQKALLELYETAKTAQHLVADAARPGVTGAQLNALFDEYMASCGLSKNGRFIGHGQGYDMMEAPVLCAAEDMEMRENMFLAIHPELVKDGVFSICCDNFLVEKDGARLLSKAAQSIFVLDV